MNWHSCVWLHTRFDKSMMFRRNYVILRQPYRRTTISSLPSVDCPITPLLWKRTTHTVHPPSTNMHGVPFLVPFIRLKRPQRLTCPHGYIQPTQGHCSYRVVLYLDIFVRYLRRTKAYEVFAKSSRTHQKEKWTVNQKYSLPLKNCKQTKYQPIRGGKLMKYKIINKYQPEHAQVDTPIPKSRTK